MLVAGDLFVTLAITIPVCFLGAVIAILVWMDGNVNTQNLRLSIPVPWSVHSRVRRRRAESELAKADVTYYENRHAALQREIVYEQLLTHKAELVTKELPTKGEMEVAKKEEVKVPKRVVDYSDGTQYIEYEK